MTIKYKTILRALISILVVSTIYIIDTHPSIASALQNAFSDADTIREEAGLAFSDNPSFVIGDILNGVFGILGTIFLLLIIYGGTLWMTAAGNEEQVTKAKKILSSATIGLFIVVLSYVISLFVAKVIIQSL